MKPLQPFEVYCDAVEGYYASLADPSVGPWYPGILKLTILMAGLGVQNSGRYAALAANVLHSLPVGQRTKFMDEYSIPSTITAMLETPPEWPEPLPVQGFEDLSETDAATFGRASEVQLALFIDTQSRRVVQGGVYTAMSYAQKLREAEGFLAATTQGGELDPGLYPHILREAEVFDVTPIDLCYTVLHKARQWAQTSSIMSAELQTFQGIVRSGATPAEITEAMATAKVNIREAMDALVNGTPDDEDVPLEDVTEPTDPIPGEEPAGE